MEDFEHYKSLVSDDEVISALVRDSKAREGILEKTRVRPNLQFFQRTVTNLVSSNNRVTEKQEQIKFAEKKRNIITRPKKIPLKRKPPIEYIREVLSNKIEFVKSSEKFHKSENRNTSEYQDVKELRASPSINSYKHFKPRRIFKQRKTPFQQIREILTNNVDKVNNLRSNSTLNQSICSKNGHEFTKQKEKYKNTDIISSFESNNFNIQKDSDFLETIITLSDSDSTDSQKSEEIDKNIGNTTFINNKSEKKRKIVL